MSDFEFDDGKRQANLDKHGIDFPSAQELWKDPDLLEFQAESDNEPRFLVIGCIAKKTLVYRRHLQKRENPPELCQAISQERDRTL